jgi:hypothetical protein
MSLLYLFAGGMLVTMASALPQAITVTSPAALCTQTVTSLGIDYTVSNYSSWSSALSVVQGTAPTSSTRIAVRTNTLNFPGLGLITAYNFADSHVLTSAGYQIITNTYTVTGACPTTTATLPPSPTGSICSPHGDHCTGCHFLPPCLSLYF